MGVWVGGVWVLGLGFGDCRLQLSSKGRSMLKKAGSWAWLGLRNVFSNLSSPEGYFICSRYNEDPTKISKP